MERTRLIEFESWPVSDEGSDDGRTRSFNFRVPQGGQVVRSEVSVYSPVPQGLRRAATLDDLNVMVTLNEVCLTQRVRDHDGVRLAGDVTRLVLRDHISYVELAALQRTWRKRLSPKAPSLPSISGGAVSRSACALRARVIVRFEMRAGSGAPGSA